MRGLLGFWLIVAAVGCLVVSCDSGTAEPTVFRVAKCAEADNVFVEIGLPDEFASPTGRGFVFRCDWDEAARESSVLPIEVYSESQRGQVIGWWYSTKCGYPEGLAKVGEAQPTDCDSKTTVATAPRAES